MASATSLSMGGLAAKRANVPQLRMGPGGLGARRGVMKLPTSSPGNLAVSDPNQNAFKKYADVV